MVNPLWRGRRDMRLGIIVALLVLFLSTAEILASSKTSLTSLEVSPDYSSLTGEAEDESEEGELFDSSAFQGANLPLTLNEKVQYFIELYQTSQREVFKLWLSRSTRYLPMIKRIFREYGLPEDLAYLAMIESGFNPFAYSRARAVGMWQFIKGTARRYGLKVNYWIDERRDPEKATKAAARYLLDLYQEFECWHLASAGYNAGETKIRKAIRRYKTKDFWELAKYRYLKRETKNYVPALIAAILIAKNPEKYGFTDVKYLPPLEYEKIEVPGNISLKAIALAAGVDYQTIRLLNAELRRGRTPKYARHWTIKVPVGRGQMVLANLPRVRFYVVREIRKHRVVRGESLRKIARRYKVSMRTIARANRLKRYRVRAGQLLRIPVQTQVFYLAKAPGKALASHGSKRPIIYMVKKGDSLWKIANRFGVSLEDLRSWNQLESKILYPGTLLTIWPGV